MKRTFLLAGVFTVAATLLHSQDYSAFTSVTQNVSGLGTEAATVVTDTNGLLQEVSRLQEVQKSIAAQLAREAKISRFDQTNTARIVTKTIGAAESLRRSLKSAEIKVYDEVAIADAGPHRAAFAPNVRAAAPVTLHTPTGELLRSRILGLCYYDPVTDKSVLIAEPKDSIGLLEAPNRLVYEDAFDEAAADVVYSYSTSSLEQDVVIRKQLPHPSEYGLEGKNIQLCVFTEFFGELNPKRSLKSVRVQSPSNALRAAFVEDLEDETVGFDGMTIVEGRAFSFANLDDTVPVGKKWVVIEGRNFLVEYTLYRALESQLETLPRMAALEQKWELQPFKKMLAARPISPARKTASLTKPAIHLSQNSVRSRPGVVMDYLIVNNSIWNINFGDGTAKSGRAAVGLNTNDTWNWYVAPAASSAALTNLLKSDGGSSTVGIVVSNALGQSQNTACADPMYKSYVYRDGSQHLTVTITNLPANVYDIFVYATRASADGAPSFELKRAGTSLWTKGTTRWGNSWYSSYWDEHEQYVRFRDITVTNQTLLIDAYPDTAGYASLSGIQIVPQEAITYETATITNAITSLINVDFAVGYSNKVGISAVGMTSTDVWNNVSFPNSASAGVANLKRADNSTTSAGLAMRNGPGYWGWPANDAMFQAYIYSQNQGNISVTITNLPSGICDVYLYGHTPTTDDNAIFDLWSDDVMWGLKGTSLAGYGPTSNKWEIGQQYIVFKDVTVSSNKPFVLQAQHNSYGYNDLAGLQIAYKTAVDSDADGLPDGWEMKWFGNLNQTAAADPDGDGLSNLREYQLGFEPLRADSDGNGVADCYESEFVWLEDAAPQGAFLLTTSETWNWVTSFSDGVGWNGGNVTPYSGAKLHLSANVTNAMHQHYFERAVSTIRANTGDVFYAYINLDPSKMPTEVMLQFSVMEDNGSYSWEHRAYWGANSISGGVNGTSSRYYMGALPASNTWVRLEVPASLVGVEGKVIEGMAFSLYSGRAAWDRAGKVTLDMDGDGLLDVWEIQYFGDLNQTPGGDYDYDGRPNLEEYQDGTNPANASSAANVLLGRWTFDNTNSWVGEQGQLPLASLNISGRPSPRTNAVFIYNTNGAYLRYRDVEANGHPNFNCQRGTLRYWFKPDWASTSAGGTGPQVNGTMISFGDSNNPFGNGWWGITASPDGNSLSFVTKGTGVDGWGTVHFAPGINWYSNTWHQVALTFSATETKIYLDGQYVTNGVGITSFPNATTRANGFKLGSPSGGNQCRGQFEELETYNYELSASEISNSYDVSPLADADGDGVTDREDADPNNPSIGRLTITIETPANGLIIY